MAVIAAAGGAVAFYLCQRTGFQSIFKVAGTVGWRGFTVLCLYQLGLFTLLGAAWHVVLPPDCSARVSVFIWARMVRDAVSELLPFSHVGGVVLGTRCAIAQGVPQPVAFGSITIDITAEMMAQVIFTAVGLMILLMGTAHARMTLSVASSATAGLLTLVAGSIAFAAFCRHGATLSRRLIFRLLPSAAPVTEAVIAYLQEAYRRPAKVLLSVGTHSCGWAASAVSTWIALFLMGVHSRLGDVLAIESLVCAARSASFWIPNGLGVQEAAFASIMPLFGIGPEIGLAASILKRARDIAVGVPILLLWQWSESHKFFSMPWVGSSSSTRISKRST